MMKTTASREDFPSPLRLVIYLALIAAIGALNCLTLDTGMKSLSQSGNPEHGNRVEQLPDVR